MYKTFDTASYREGRSRLGEKLQESAVYDGCAIEKSRGSRCPRRLNCMFIWEN